MLGPVGESRAPDTEPGTALVVNGERHVMACSATVADLVSSWCTSPDGIAVARNREVVPRSEWATTMLSAHDVVEIVTAAAGG
jgi:sulfur carrier protein